MYEVVTTVKFPSEVVVPYSICAVEGLSVDQEIVPDERLIEEVETFEIMGLVTSFTFGVTVVKLYLVPPTSTLDEATFPD